MGAFETCARRLGYTLRYLCDRSKLNSSPLARLACVERLAKNRYDGHVLPRGLALRELILSCVNQVTNDAGKDPGLSRACQYLHLRATGLSCRQISDQMHLSREHVSRFYRRKALALLTERFLSMIDGDI